MGPSRSDFMLEMSPDQKQRDKREGGRCQQRDTGDKMSTSSWNWLLGGRGIELGLSEGLLEGRDLSWRGWGGQCRETREGEAPGARLGNGKHKIESGKGILDSEAREGA